VTWIGFADGDDAQVAPFAGVDQAAFSTVLGPAGAEGSGTGAPQPAPSSASPLAAGDPARSVPTPDQESDPTQQVSSHSVPPSQPPTEEHAVSSPAILQQDSLASPERQAIEPQPPADDPSPALEEDVTELPVDDHAGNETQADDAPEPHSDQSEEQAVESSADPQLDPAPAVADRPADPLTAADSPADSLPSVEQSESDLPQPLLSNDPVADGAPGSEGVGGTSGAVKDPMAALSDIDTAAASSIRVNSDMWKSGRPIAREGMVIKPYPLLRHIVRDSGDTIFSLGGTGGVQRNPIVAVQFDRRGKVARVEILRTSGLTTLDEKYLASWMARWTAVDSRLAKLKDGEFTNPIVFRLIFVPEPDESQPAPASEAGK